MPSSYDVFFYNGVLDDVRIYDEALSAADIAGLATLGTQGSVCEPCAQECDGTDGCDCTDTCPTDFVAARSFDEAGLQQTDAADGTWGPLGGQRIAGRYGAGFLPNATMWADALTGCSSSTPAGCDAYGIWEAGDFAYTDAFTVGLWLQRSSTSSASYLVSRMFPDGAERGWSLYVDSSRYLRFTLQHDAEASGGANALSVRTNTTLSGTAWRHIVVTYDGSGNPAGIKFYVDGAAPNRTTLRNTLSGTIQTAAPFLVGGRSNTTDLSTHALDEVILLDRVLSASEIAHWYSLGSFPCSTDESWCPYPTGGCDGDVWNGCEVDLSDDPAHCGACDAACAGVCAGGLCWDGDVEAVCDNGLDEDADSLVDCADPDCDEDRACCEAAESCVPGEYTCTEDTDCPGDWLCEELDDRCYPNDYCSGEPCVPPEPETACDDMVDNDGDGLMDCWDPDCAEDAACGDGDAGPLAGCTAHADCAQIAGSALCYDEERIGVPGGACMLTCDLAADNCVGTTVCINVGLDNGAGICSQPCWGGVGCAVGEACVNHGDPSMGVCVPGCTLDADCGSDRYCQASTGLCNAVDPTCLVDDGLGGLEVDCGNVVVGCDRAPSCTPSVEVGCDDGLDQDRDGWIDCADPDCSADAACSNIPPDPLAVSPRMDVTTETTRIERLAFLFQGSAPIIQGLNPAELNPTATVAVRGRVFNANGDPLPGVRVHVSNEVGATTGLGYSHTRQDGTFDVLANGVRTVRIVYTLAGYRTVTRRLQLGDEPFSDVEDVVMLAPAGSFVALDPRTTSVLATSGAAMDDDGEREVTLNVQAGTTASWTVGSTTTTINQFSIRVTESTVGLAGPAAMQAPLPPATAYTYAAWFDIEEAPADTRVTFNKPVVAYVTDFLGFGAGAEIPSGWLNPETGYWESEQPGVVIEVEGVDTNGRAILTEETVDALEELHDLLPSAERTLRRLPETLDNGPLDDDELLRLGDMWSAQTDDVIAVWRMPVQHFSYYDFNPSPNSAIVPADWTPADPRVAYNDDHRGCQTSETGSIIDCGGRTVSQVIPVAGAGFDLIHEGINQFADARSRSVQLPGWAEVVVEGQVITGPDNSLVTWDGNDRFGNQVRHDTPFEVRVFQRVISCPRASNVRRRSGFGGYRVGVRTSSLKCSTLVFTTRFNGIFPSWNADELGLGGWRMTPHHAVDRTTGTVVTQRAREAAGAVGPVGFIRERRNPFSGAGCAIARADARAETAAGGCALGVVSESLLLDFVVLPSLRATGIGAGLELIARRKMNTPAPGGATEVMISRHSFSEPCEAQTELQTASVIMAAARAELGTGYSYNQPLLGRLRADSGARYRATLWVMQQYPDFGGTSQADTYGRLPGVLTRLIEYPSGGSTEGEPGCVRVQYGGSTDPARPNRWQFCRARMNGDSIVPWGTLTSPNIDPTAMYGLKDFAIGNNGDLWLVQQSTTSGLDLLHQLVVTGDTRMQELISGSETSCTVSVSALPAWGDSSATPVAMSDVCLARVVDLHVDTVGNVDIAMNGAGFDSGAIVRLNTNGEAWRLIGHGASPSSPNYAEGALSADATVTDITAIDHDEGGRVYFREGAARRIRAFTPGLEVSTVVGCSNFTGDSESCTTFVITDPGNPARSHLESFGCGLMMRAGYPEPPNAAPTFAVTTEGLLLVDARRELVLIPAQLTGATCGYSVVGSEADSAPLVFDGSGRHIATLDSVSLAPVVRYRYEEDARRPFQVVFPGPQTARWADSLHIRDAQTRTNEQGVAIDAETWPAALSRTCANGSCTTLDWEDETDTAARCGALVAAPTSGDTVVDVTYGGSSITFEAPGGQTTTLGLRGGRVTSATTTSGFDERYVYDRDGALIARVDTEGIGSFMRLDRLGRVLEVRNARGRTVQLSETTNGPRERTVTVTRDDGRVSSHTRGFRFLGPASSTGTAEVYGTMIDDSGVAVHYTHPPGSSTMTVSGAGFRRVVTEAVTAATHTARRGMVISTASTENFPLGEEEEPAWTSMASSCAASRLPEDGSVSGMATWSACAPIVSLLPSGMTSLANGLLTSSADAVWVSYAPGALEVLRAYRLPQHTRLEHIDAEGVLTRVFMTTGGYVYRVEAADGYPAIEVDYDAAGRPEAVTRHASSSENQLIWVGEWQDALDVDRNRLESSWTPASLSRFTRNARGLMTRVAVYDAEGSGEVDHVAFDYDELNRATELTANGRLSHTFERTHLVGAGSPEMEVTWTEPPATRCTPGFNECPALACDAETNICETDPNAPQHLATLNSDGVVRSVVLPSGHRIELLTQGGQCSAPSTYMCSPFVHCDEGACVMQNTSRIHAIRLYPPADWYPMATIVVRYHRSGELAGLSGLGTVSLDMSYDGTSHPGSRVRFITSSGDIGAVTQRIRASDGRVHGLEVTAGDDSDPHTLAATYETTDRQRLEGFGPVAWTKDAEGRVATSTVEMGSNSIGTRYWYDDYGRLIRMASATDTPPSSSLADCDSPPAGTRGCFEFAYDEADRVSEERHRIHNGAALLDQAWTYSYTPGTSRLATIDSDGLRTTWTWDPNGARMVGETRTIATDAAVSETGAVAVDGRDKLLFHGNSEFGYDANGRRRWSRHFDDPSYFIQCLGYDVFGALLTVQTRTTTVGTEADPCDHFGPWTEVAYGVDVTGRRVTRDDGTTQTAWLYQDALNPVAQLDGLGRLQQVYVYATRGHVPDAIQVFDPDTGTQTATWAVISDLRGSVRAVVDVATGSVVQQLSYDAWGVVTYDSAPGTQPFGYAGGLYDHATELVRYGARDYDPLVGRWTAPDPIGFGGGDTNLYAYVGGDPVNFVDPTGLYIETGWDVFNIVTGFASFTGNVAAGNVIGAAVDGVGLVIDVGATVFPGVPAGAGSGIRASRAGDAAVSGVQANRRMGRAAQDCAIPRSSENFQRVQGVREGYHVPDFWEPGRMLVEVKHVLELTDSRQLETFRNLVTREGGQLYVLVRETTHVSAPLRRAFENSDMFHIYRVFR